MNRKQWSAAQARYNAAHDTYLDARNAAEARWQAVRYAPGTVRRRIEALARSVSRAEDQIMSLLEGAPRDWRAGVPWAWVCSSLSFEDATRPRSEPLSVVPPCSYGSNRPIE